MAQACGLSKCPPGEPSVEPGLRTTGLTGLSDPTRVQNPARGPGHIGGVGGKFMRPAFEGKRWRDINNSFHELLK